MFGAIEPGMKTAFLPRPGRLVVCSSSPMKTTVLRFACMAALLAGGSWILGPPAAPPAAGRLRFEECGRALGIDHRHSLCLLSSRSANIMPWLTSVGAAAAAADYDGDGRPDLYVTQLGPGRPTTICFRNRGDGTFEDVTEQAGVGCGNPRGRLHARHLGRHRQ